MSHRPAGVAPAEVGSKGGRTHIKTLSPSESRPVPRRGLSRAEAAMYLGISPSKFDELRKSNRIAPPKVLDGRLIFTVERLDEFLDALPDENQTEDEWTATL
jgi:hypothetical protein